MNYKDKQRSTREALKTTRVAWDPTSKGTLNMHIKAWKHAVPLTGKFVKSEKRKAWESL